MDRTTHTIDATGKSLGRLASEIAKLLRGKHKPTWVSYKDIGDFVVVRNIKKLKFTGRKFEQKTYHWHSGYPGGLKERRLRDLFEEDSARVLRKTVLGMLPKNKLRSHQIKRLKIDQ